MYEVTVKGDTPAALKGNLAVLLASMSDVGTTRAPSKGAERTAEPVDEAPPARAKPAKPAKEPETDELDYETDVKPHVVALSKEIGREVALEVLGKFTNAATDEPCTKGSEVSPEDYPALLKAIKKARAKHEAD